MYALVWIWSRYMTINKKHATQVRILGASTNIKYLEEAKRKLEEINSQKYTISYAIIEIEHLV